MNAPKSTRHARPPQAIAGVTLVLVTLGIVSVGMIVSWFWLVTNALAFGPVSRFWWQATLITVGSLITIGATRWFAARNAYRIPGLWFWLASLALLAIAAGVWQALASPFSRGLPLTLGFAISSWWLCAVWLSQWTDFRPNVRWSIRLIAALLALSFGLCWQAAGLDGDALPRFAWRFPLSTDPAPAAPDSSPAASAKEQVVDALNPATDYPRFRGADGLGTLTGQNLARTWSAQPPPLLWRHAVGGGWGSIAVAGTRVFTQEQRAEQECTACYDRRTGRELWVNRQQAHYQNPTTGGGPRATPTVDAAAVYAYGATGLLTCLDRMTGRQRWIVDTLQDTGALPPQHGLVSSPLLVDNLVVVAAGGNKETLLVAYDQQSGKRAWAAGDDLAGYTSPIVAELAGVRQILYISKSYLWANDPASGRQLWRMPFSNIDGTNCSQPYPINGNQVFASTNFGAGCRLFQASAAGEQWTAQELWNNRTLETKFSSAVLHQGHAFGFDDGILECVSLVDGSRRWKRGRYGHGQLMLADDLLIIQAEDGQVALVEAIPERYNELGIFQALNGQTWNYPALSDGQLFVRNDHEMACYELPKD